MNYILLLCILGYAQKTCTNNGTWWSDPTTNREWTDYTPCLNLKVIWVSVRAMMFNATFNNISVIS